jgi:hypothetical protein
MPSVVTASEFPPKADLHSQIYKPLPETAKLVEWDKVDARTIANETLGQLSIALDAADSKILERLFRTPACHWKDTLALTAHLRTLNGSSVVASALKELHQERGIHDIGLDFASTMGLDDKVVRHQKTIIIHSETLISSARNGSRSSSPSKLSLRPHCAKDSFNQCQKL